MELVCSLGERRKNIFLQSSQVGSRPNAFCARQPRVRNLLVNVVGGKLGSRVQTGQLVCRHDGIDRVRKGLSGVIGI